MLSNIFSFKPNPIFKKSSRIAFNYFKINVGTGNFYNLRKKNSLNKIYFISYLYFTNATVTRKW